MLEEEIIKDRFFATVAHELRNPLTPLTNAVYIIRQHLLDPSTILTATDAIERQIGNLTVIINDLVDVARVISNKLILNKQIFGVNALTGLIVTQINRGEFNKHNVNFHPLAHEVCIEADATRFEQVITNLLTNAFRYTPQGGNIDVGVSNNDNMVFISVKDTGIGMEPEILSSVFELYSQAKTSQEGLGVGLYLVKKIVGLHGGDVTVSSSGINKGSEFVVSFPLKNAPCICCSET